MKSNKNVVIVEDDIFMQRILEKMLISNFSSFTVVGKAASVKAALEIITEKHPDLLILDIQLEDGTAFDLLQQIEIGDFKIIFVSGNQSYFEMSMQFAAVDFIVKPFDENDFVIAIEKALEAWNDTDYHHRLEIMFSNFEKSSKDWKLVLPSDNETITLDLNSLLYGESVRAGSNFVMTTGEIHFAPIPLRRYESLLTPYGFFRCHPLYVVNLCQIQTMDTQNKEIHFVSEQTIPYEERREDNLMRKWKEALIRDEEKE